MSTIKYRLLHIVLFMVFTQGMWERILGNGSMIPTILLEASVLLFIFIQFKIIDSVPAKALFCLTVIYALLAGLYNGNSITDMVLYLRYLLYGILIYYQIYSLPIGAARWYKLLKFCVLLILLQGIGSFYNTFIYGERIEGYVGTMSSLGGTTATTFPIFISSIILLVYLFKIKVSRSFILWSLLLFVCVFMVAYSSSKRGIYLMLPTFLFIVVSLSALKIGRLPFFKKKLINSFLFSIALFPLLIFGIVNTHGLNYGLEGEESSLQIITNALIYTEEYETSTDQYGASTGRRGTTENIVSNLYSNSDFLWFGTGFGTVKDSLLMSKLRIGYGIVGITRDIISGGLIFSLLVLFTITTLILTNNSSYSNIFSTTLRRVLLFLFLYIHFSYSSDFTVHLKINIMMFIVLSLINSPLHTNVNRKFMCLLKKK